MNKYKVLKIVVYNNGKKSFYSLEDNYEDIDEAIEYLMNYDTSEIDKDVAMIKFKPISYENEEGEWETSIDFNTVICSKFKDEWIVSDYLFSLDLLKENEEPLVLAYGTEADIANHLWDNYESVFSPLSKDINIKEIRERITADDSELEELLDEVSTTGYTLKLTDR